MARTLRYSTEVASSQPRPPRAVLPGWKLQGMKAVNPPVSSCRLRTTSKWLMRWSNGFADAEHHGGGGAHAEFVGGAMDADPVGGAAFEAGDALADVVVEDFGAAAGDGVEAGVAEAGDGGAQVEFGVLGDGEDFRCGEAVEPDLGEALLDAGEEAFEPVDFEIGMKAALHEDAGAAHLQGFGDLLVDFFEREDVALVGAGNVFAFFGERAVEGAEGAVLGAEVGVVDVAIDDVGDDALGVEAAADGVGLEAQPDEVRGVEVIEGLLAGQRHETVYSFQFRCQGRGIGEPVR